MIPTITRLSDHGPWARYKVTGDDPARHVTLLVATRNGKPCIDHTIDCLASLHAWPDVFEAWRGYRDIPNGFDLTDVGRELLAQADESWVDAEFDRIEKMTDEEILADAKARGVDIEAEAERVRKLLLDACRKAREARDRIMADPMPYRKDAP